MSTDDGALWICYNGEVYGWQDDARQLADRGVRFHTWSDTEFILRGYEAWGIEGLLPRLRGMFAIAIVDFRTRRVHAPESCGASTLARPNMPKPTPQRPRKSRRVRNRSSSRSGWRGGFIGILNSCNLSLT